MDPAEVLYSMMMLIIILPVISVLATLEYQEYQQTRRETELEDVFIKAKADVTNVVKMANKKMEKRAERRVKREFGIR